MSPTPTILGRLRLYAALTRMDRPWGSVLLLWPTLCALWLAAGGLPDFKLLLIFMAGTFLMRSAGCAINDFADRDFDAHVKRTEMRPLAQKLIGPGEALAVFAVLVGLAFGLVLMTNTLTIQLSFAAAGLAVLYPFTKRYTHLPQVFLGAAFNFGIPMAYAAQRGWLDGFSWLLFFAGLFWTVAYDTFYAMVDRDDDIKVGIKSTAVLFGDWDRLITAALQGLALLIFAVVGWEAGLGTIFAGFLAATGMTFVWQQWLIRSRQREACFQAFLHSQLSGLLLFLGVALDLALA